MERGRVIEPDHVMEIVLPTEGIALGAEEGFVAIVDVAGHHEAILAVIFAIKVLGLI